MFLQVLLEGLGLGLLLILLCAFLIRKGAVNMVHLYHADVQARCVELGLITQDAIHRNQRRFKLIGISGYLGYILIFAYAVNGARGFAQGFWQMFGILSVMNLIDRFLVDDFWVGHTKAWVIPGTESFQPYITSKDKKFKWLFGTVGMAVISAILAGIMALILR